VVSALAFGVVVGGAAVVDCNCCWGCCCCCILLVVSMGVGGMFEGASNVTSIIHLGRGWELGTLISHPAPAGRRLWRGADVGVADG